MTNYSRYESVWDECFAKTFVVLTGLLREYDEFMDQTKEVIRSNETS